MEVEGVGGDERATRREILCISNAQKNADLLTSTSKEKEGIICDILCGPRTFVSLHTFFCKKHRTHVSFLLANRTSHAGKTITLSREMLDAVE